MKKSSAIQCKLLKLYKIFLKICEDNSIDFFAEGGTKIGAEFWEGFIPWDDDIDVGMTADNVEKFIKAVEHEGEAYGCAINNGMKSHKLDVLALKFYDKNSTYVSNNVISEPDSYNGLFIDVFLYIGLPDRQEDRLKFIEELTNVNDSLYRKRLFDLGKTNVADLLDRFNHLSKKYDIYKSKYATIAANASGQVFEVDKLIKTRKVKFADSYIYSPIGAKDQIYQQYKDFKKEPTKDEKNKSSHEKFSFIDLDTSFEYYKDKIQSDKKIRNLFSHMDKYISSMGREIFRIGDDKNNMYLQNSIYQNKIDKILEENKKITNLNKYLVSRNRSLENERIKIFKSFRWRITHPIGIMKNQIKKWSKK